MDLESLGHAAAAYQQDPRVIAACLKAVGVTEPHLRLNGVAYYRVDDIVSAIQHLATIDAKAAAESVDQ